MQVNGFVISTGDPGPPRLYLAVRGRRVATNPSQPQAIPYAPSISGAAAQGRYGGWKEIDFDMSAHQIRYDPQVTMLREGSEEVWGRGKEGEARPFPRSWDATVRFLGLSRVLTFYEPFLFGHIELNITETEFKEFLATSTDKFDVERLHTVELDRDSAIAFARDNSPITHSNAGAAVSVVLFMLYHEICYRYPESISDFTKPFVSALKGLPT